MHQRRSGHRHAELQGQVFHLRECADRAAAVAAAASAVLVRLIERHRLDLGRRARPAFRHARPDGRPPRPTSTPSRRRWRSAARRRSRRPEFSGGIAIGVQRHIFVADTDAEAHRFAKPAMEVHLENLNWLRVKHSHRPDLAAQRAARRDFRGLCRGRHRDRRLAADRARRNRAAGRRSSASIIC